MTFIADDLPELDRPTKATTAPISSGDSEILEALLINFVLLKFIQTNSHYLYNSNFQLQDLKGIMAISYEY